MITPDLVLKLWKTVQLWTDPSFKDGLPAKPVDSSVALAVAKAIWDITIDHENEWPEDQDSRAHQAVGFLCGVLYGLQLDYRTVCEDPAFEELSQLIPGLPPKEGSLITEATYVCEDDGTLRKLS